MNMYAVSVIRGKFEKSTFCIEAVDPAQAIVKLIKTKIKDTTLPYIELSSDLLI